MKKFKLLLSVFTALSTISLSACESNVYYTVTFDSKGGTEVETQTVRKNSYATRPINPEKNGYDLNDWTSRGQSFDFENTKITDNITLRAKWNAHTYSITYTYSQDGNTNTNPTTYTIEDEVYLYAPSYSQENYHFSYFVDQNGFQYNGKINKGTTGNLVLTDVWEADMYKVTANADSEYFEGLGEYKCGDEVKIKYTKDTPKGFYFTCIYVRHSYTDEHIFNQKEFSFTMPAYDLNITVHYDPIIYVIDYELDGGTNNSNNPNCVTIYSYDEVLPLYAPTKAGYTFAYWTYNDVEISELNVANYIDTITAGGPRNIVAHWEKSN